MSREYVFQRERMIRRLESKGIRDSRVLQAMMNVPRHRFVAGPMQSKAYSEHALPIGHAQTISQPLVVARMTELLEVGPDDSVLEIGTGSGYQTAILATLAGRVYSLERIADLAREAIGRMRELGIGNVKIQGFDGTVGWSEVAPFDRILVTAGAPGAPQPLLDQLKVGGRMLIPEGEREAQRLTLYEKKRKGIVRTEGEAAVFVPLIGRHGWKGD